MKRRTFAAVFPALLSLLLLVPARAEDPDWDLLPADMTEETRQPGVIQVIEYETAQWEIDKLHAGIYLPYHYDPGKYYDIVFFWPGTNGDYKDLLLTEYPMRGEDGENHPVTGKELLDRLIETGRTRPFLLVCMHDVEFMTNKTVERDLETVMAFIEEFYSTYAADPALTREEIRDHYTLAGFSQGAINAEGVGMVWLFARFSSFGAISYGSRWDLIPELVDASPYSLRLLYALSGGKDDPGRYLTRHSYEVLTSMSRGAIRDGDNAILRETTLYPHDYDLALLGLYDMLPRILDPQE